MTIALPEFGIDGIEYVTEGSTVPSPPEPPPLTSVIVTGGIGRFGTALAVGAGADSAAATGVARPSI